MSDKDGAIIKMGYEFGDVTIPPRAAEFSVPLDFTVSFVYRCQPARLEMNIFADGNLRRYEGRGRFSLPGGFARHPDLALLDPFMLERKYIPSRYFKIFFKAQYPKLCSSGISANCDLVFTDRPAVLITVNKYSDVKVEYDLRWQARRDLMRSIDGFGGYISAGHTIYRGTETDIRSVPHSLDGAYISEDGEADGLRALYWRASYLFDVRDKTFIDKERTSYSVTPKPETVRRTRGARIIGGPALISFHSSSQNRAGTSKYLHFVMEAKRLADYKPPKASFSPLSCYFPTYRQMSREQRNWYFYWRGEFYAGNVLKTDLSYIFVAIYELINRVYPSPELTISRMFALWESYRKTFPRLDRYMPRWCVDYIITSGIQMDFSEIIRRIPLPAAFLQPYVEIYFNETLKQGLHALPLYALEPFSNYDIRQSRFYAGREDICRDAVHKALAETDRVIREIKGAGLLDTLAPKPVREVWDSYRGAVCGRAAARRIEMEYVPFTRSPKLRQTVAAIIKHTENHLRKKEKFAGRLRGFELPAQISDAIDRVLDGRPAAVRIEYKAPVIDLGRALELEAESWENTRRLIDAAGAGDEEPEAPDVSEVPAEAKEDENTEELAQSESLTAQFSSDLNDFQREFLSELMRSPKSPRLNELATAQFTFPEAVIDEINELAADILGDIVIDPDNREVFEEHMAALADILL